MKDKIKEFFVKNKKAVIIGGIAIVILIIGIVIAVISSKGKKDETTPVANTPVTYTLNVLTNGGMAFDNKNVYVYDGDTNGDLIDAGRTNENGQFEFTTDVAVSSLGFVIDGLPKDGYELKDVYKISEAMGDDNDQLYIYINTQIVELTDMENTTFDEGSIIKDFAVTTPDGTEVTISKLLNEYDAVVLNFFYLDCQPCRNEFPYLENAYQKYGDKVAVIALTPVDKNNDEIQKLIEELGLSFYVAQCDSMWEQMMSITAYPTTVVIDRWGMISFIHTGSVTEEGVFEAIFEYYSSDDYVQSIVYHLDDIVSAEAEEGTENKPICILPDSTEFEAEVAAGKEVYFEIPKVSNMIMTINDADAYVIYEDEKYEAVDGVVELVISAPDPYTPAVFIIGNAGSSDETFKATLVAMKGTMMNPYELTLGEFTVNIEAGNEQGVYHTFTATESGTLSCSSVIIEDGITYDITLYNLNSYVNHTLDADANEDGSVSIVVNKGDVVRIIVATLPNANNEYPDATVKGELTFVAGEGTDDANDEGETKYTVTVKDADGNAVSNIKVVIDTAELTTDASGKVSATLKTGAYAVSITPPDGYKVQGTVTVSADMPDVTVTLVSVNAKQIEYTVKVTNESGTAISGATVIVGSSITTTNASGVATLTLAEGSYDVTASANGYAPGSASVTKSTTSVTIKLKKGASISNGVTYTVNAVDYKGNALSGVTVIFKSGSTAKATATTNSSGKATAQLEKGTYDVVLVYDGYGYDSSNAKVTSSATSVTIMMAKTITTTEEAYYDATGVFVIKTGAQYIDIPDEDANNTGGVSFCEFTPKKAGYYTIEVSNSAATVSVWGYISTDGNSTYLTAAKKKISINVKETGPTYTIGIKGVSNCIITVTKTGDAILDDNDMDWTDYTATDTVKSYTFSGGTLTYVDITKSTSTYNLVYNSSDGYYHLGSTSGPVMLVHLGSGAPIIALSDVIGYTGSGGSNFGKFIYNGSTLIMKENYTSLLWTYMENMDQTKYVYPLTKDLMYMLKNGGEYRGWWASSGDSNVIYTAIPTLNSEIAWMWACCYVAE